MHSSLMLVAEEEKRYKTTTKNAEEEEAKRIAVVVANFERKKALDRCADFGVTMTNTLGLSDINPRLLGMKGASVDLGKMNHTVLIKKVKPDTSMASTKQKRVDLSAIAEAGVTYVAPTLERNDHITSEFIRLEVGGGEDFTALNYNHKLRRKLRRAIEAAEVQKELMVRDRVCKICVDQGLEIGRAHV